ncbi:MAG: VWA domain-containing protein, partial [Clostridiaceae bacterium]|nr:VWA domain-containing protein [Clostridiaceae bacterium]
MTENNKSVKVMFTLVGIAVLVFGLIYGGITLTKNMGKSKKTISTENAMEKLDKLYRNITVNKVDARKGYVEIETPDIKDS